MHIYYTQGLSNESVKLTGSDPKDICFTKAKGNLKLLYAIPLHIFSWYSLQRKMHAEFSEVATASHASLSLINCKQHLDDCITVFIYRWGELLV